MVFNLTMLSLGKGIIPTIQKYVPFQITYLRASLIGTTTFVATAIGINQFMGKREKLVIDNNKYVDDITGMNKTSVYKVIQPTCPEDIMEAIYNARQSGKQISMFGQRHTMGKHTIAKDGIVLDMTRYDKVIAFDKEKKTITVQPGITWAKVIHYLDPHGLSPMVLQSYATFSVGGTIGPNGHGITSDRTLADSIISFKLAMSDGTIVECTREKNSQLFSLVIGGYGLFGVVTEVTLKVVENSQLKMSSKQLIPSSFTKEYLPLVDNPEIGVKLGRINVGNFDDITLFSFKKEETDIVSGVSAKPHCASKIMQLLYKWVADTYIGQRIRSAIEKILGRPLDWAITCDTNGSLYESADPIATLWSPIFNRNKTHILQEYFIPANGKNFEDWAKDAGTYFQSHKFKNVSLLNATIRFVKKDTNIFLNYAKEDMFAVVLYYRLDKLYDGDTELQEINKHLTDLTVSLGGTFYLPYRHHYSIEKLKEAYPQWNAFVQLKKLYDSHNVFSNEWWKNYSANCINDDAVIKREIDKTISERSVQIASDNIFMMQCHGNHNFHNLWKFSTYVFNMVDFKDIPILNTDMTTEKETYEMLAQFVKSRSFFTNTVKGLGVLKTQKTELVDETINLMKKLGKKDVNGYMAIGDCGRYVNGIKKGLRVSGPTYIVHDNQSFIQDSVERGSIFQRGKFININYNDVTADFLKDVKDQSMELITLYIGLHHFTPQNLDRFLKEVRRVLKPNGVFILRDHNATEDIKPLLVFAHTYFNALTGVSWEDNKKEVRNFTTIRQLREQLYEYGLIDSMYYEKQLHDPTENFLMAFKPETEIPDDIRLALEQSKTYKRSQVNGFHTVSEWASVDIFQTFGNSMDHTPFYKFEYFRAVNTYWKLFFKQTRECAKQEGWKNTLMSDGILMDMMLGSFITIGFLPLGLICMPMKWWYSKPQNADYSTQEIILSTGGSLLDTENLNGGRILKNWKAMGDTFYHVELARYKPFTKTMIELSKNRDFKVFKIGGCDSIPVKISYDGDVMDKELLASMLVQDDGMSWGNITSVYKMTEHNRAIVIVNMKVTKLLDLIRFLNHNTKFKLEHVHDP